VRDPGRDLTEWMGAAETGEAVRVGLAHGSIRDFRSVEEMGGEGGAVIAPDRAARAGLSYLGFGDWHGRIEVNSNTWYSGTPEQDSFKPHRPAGALIVEIAGENAAPKVTEVETGQFSWIRLTLDFLEGEGAVERFAAALPALAARSQALLDLRAEGRGTLAARAALEAAANHAAPDFLWFDQDLSSLAVCHVPEDLAVIDRRGAVRDAAEALAEAAEAGDGIAAAALARLYSYAVEGELE
ncbi:MAG: DNA repair exonuclease, partial [Thioclava sp.]|nr:DNA repair exonuclease [Thioclava sp.]